MKKTYISPRTELTLISMGRHLLTGSVRGSEVYEDPADEEQDVLTRRRRDIWEDDEEYANDEEGY